MTLRCLASLRSSLMEAKDVAVWQRDIGDDILGGSRPVTTGTAKVRGDEQKSSQACMSGTSLQHKAKSSIHYKLCPYTRRPRIERHVFTLGGLPCAMGSRVRRKLAEGRATCFDRMEEVSRGHNVTGGNEMRELPAGQA